MDKIILVSLIGCDDTTYFYYPYSEEGIEHLKLLVDLSNQHSSYQCQPVMSFFILPKEVADRYEVPEEHAYKLEKESIYSYNGKHSF